MKIDYEINNKEMDIKIIRLFLERGIANWEEKEGLEVSMRTSVPDKVIKIQIVDENNLVWFYNFKTNAGNVTTKKIQFTDFSIDEKFEQILRGDMALKRVKNLLFSWGTNLEKEKGDIEVYGIKVY